MKDYRKLYADYYGISWDPAKFEVHHIDGNRQNNDIDNLILLPKELHQRLHHSGSFDLQRYETQVLTVGRSDQDPDEIETRILAINACQPWAQLRAVNYRWPSGESMGKITEETAL